MIPDLVTPRSRWARLWYKTCPDCGAKFFNSAWQWSAAGYPLHYAVTHLGISPFRRLT